MIKGDNTETIINKQEIGKLNIYLKSDETVKREKMIHAFPPKTMSAKILEEAKKANIRNAHLYRTHATYEPGSNVLHYNVETGNDVPFCVFNTKRTAKQRVLYYRCKRLTHRTAFQFYTTAWRCGSAPRSFHDLCQTL